MSACGENESKFAILQASAVDGLIGFQGFFCTSYTAIVDKLDHFIAFPDVTLLLNIFAGVPVNLSISGDFFPVDLNLRNHIMYALRNTLDICTLVPEQSYLRAEIIGILNARKGNRLRTNNARLLQRVFNGIYINPNIQIFQLDSEGKCIRLSRHTLYLLGKVQTALFLSVFKRRIIEPFDFFAGGRIIQESSQRMCVGISIRRIKEHRIHVAVIRSDEIGRRNGDLCIAELQQTDKRIHAMVIVHIFFILFIRVFFNSEYVPSRRFISQIDVVESNSAIGVRRRPHFIPIAGVVVPQGQIEDERLLTVGRIAVHRLAHRDVGLGGRRQILIYTVPFSAFIVHSAIGNNPAGACAVDNCIGILLRHQHNANACVNRHIRRAVEIEHHMLREVIHEVIYRAVFPGRRMAFYIIVISAITDMILAKRYAAGRIKIEYNRLARVLRDKQSVVLFGNPALDRVGVQVNRRIFRQIQQIDFPRINANRRLVLKQLVGHVNPVTDDRLNDVSVQIGRIGRNNMHPRPVCHIADVGFRPIVAHIHNRIRAVHMATADFQIISTRGGLRISNHDHAAIAGQVGLHNIAGIVFIRGKVGLNMAALIKELRSDAIIHAGAKDRAVAVIMGGVYLGQLDNISYDCFFAFIGGLLGIPVFIRDGVAGKISAVSQLSIVIAVRLIGQTSVFAKNQISIRFRIVGEFSAGIGAVAIICFVAPIVYKRLNAGIIDRNNLFPRARFGLTNREEPHIDIVAGGLVRSLDIQIEELVFRNRAVLGVIRLQEHLDLIYRRICLFQVQIRDVAISNIAIGRIKELISRNITGQFENVFKSGRNIGVPFRFQQTDCDIVEIGIIINVPHILLV